MRIGAITLIGIVAFVASADLTSARDYYRPGFGGYYEPPCEPGKHRVIINGNSQCRYPGEAAGGRGYGRYRHDGYRGGGYYGGADHYYGGADYYYRYGHGPRGAVVGQGPSVGCPPGQVRVMDRGNGQCR